MEVEHNVTLSAAEVLKTKEQCFSTTLEDHIEAFNINIFTQQITIQEF